MSVRRARDPSATTNSALTVPSRTSSATRRAEPERVGPRGGDRPVGRQLDPRCDRPVIRPQRKLHPHRNAAAQALDDPHEPRRALGATGHEVDYANRAFRRLVLGLEHKSPRPIATRRCRTRPPPAPAANSRVARHPPAPRSTTASHSAEHTATRPRRHGRPARRSGYHRRSRSPRSSTHPLSRDRRDQAPAPGLNELRAPSAWSRGCDHHLRIGPSRPSPGAPGGQIGCGRSLSASCCPRRTEQPAVGGGFEVVAELSLGNEPVVPSAMPPRWHRSPSAREKWGLLTRVIRFAPPAPAR